MAGRLACGAQRSVETVRDGIDAAPATFVAMLAGWNTGKMVVRVPPRGE
jgi:NADPH-dependent curcumin reductase CurA